MATLTPEVSKTNKKLYFSLQQAQQQCVCERVCAYANINTATSLQLFSQFHIVRTGLYPRITFSLAHMELAHVCDVCEQAYILPLGIVELWNRSKLSHHQQLDSLHSGCKVYKAALGNQVT